MLFVDPATAPQIDDVIALRWLGRGPNSLLLYGDPPTFQQTLDYIAQSRVVTELLVAEEGLANVQILVDAGWVCIDLRPLMRRRVQRGNEISTTRDVLGLDATTMTELHQADEIAQATEVMQEAFGLNAEMLLRPISDRWNTPSNLRYWGLCDDGDMVSSAITVQVEDTVVLWNVATRASRQRRGYGRTLLAAIHRQFPVSTGVRQFLLSSSESGKRLYEDTGYEIVDWWQAWSRPRWALGRA